MIHPYRIRAIGHSLETAQADYNANPSRVNGLRLANMKAQRYSLLLANQASMDRREGGRA